METKYPGPSLIVLRSRSMANPVEDGGANYITSQIYTSLGDIYKMSEATGKLSKQEKANYTSILKQRKMSRIDILSLVLSER